MVEISAYHFHALIAKFIMLWRFADAITGFFVFILSMLCCSWLEFTLPGVTECDAESAQDAKMEAGDCKRSTNRLPEWMFEGNAAKLLDSQKPSSVNTITPVKSKRKCTLENEVYPSVHSYRKTVADDSKISKVSQHVVGA